MTTLQEAVTYLEVYAKASHPTLGVDTPLQGFRIAIKILRNLMKIDFREPNEALLHCVDDWVVHQNDSIMVDIKHCTECQESHGAMKVSMVKCDIPNHFWYLCPSLMQPAYLTIELDGKE